MKTIFSFIHSKSYEQFAAEDFAKIKQRINQTSLHPETAGRIRFHADYHLGQIKCLNRYISADIVDLSTVGKGIWIQIDDQNNISFIPASCSIIKPAYINTLIRLFTQYKTEDSLHSQLSLRPFGTAYQYTSG